MENSNQIPLAELTANKEIILSTFRNFGIEIERIDVTVGSTVSLYEVRTKSYVRKDLEAEIVFSLGAIGVRMIIDKKIIKVEVPNENRSEVPLLPILESEEFQNSTFDLPIVLGETFGGKNVIVDLTQLSHLLVGGATGQGKSSFLHTVIHSLLHKKSPEELQFALIDTGKLEFQEYEGLKNRFLANNEIVTDSEKAIEMLNSLCQEMDNRYELLKTYNTQNIKEYNAKTNKKMPYIVTIIDEFSDLIVMTGKEFELPIARLSQLGRAVGIHLIISTQRPSANILTKTIKANFPARVVFRVSSVIDSSTILNAKGANQLLGRGDMLFSQGNDLVRIQGALIDWPEIYKAVKFIGEQTAEVEPFVLPKSSQAQKPLAESMDLDPLFDEATQWVKKKKEVSIEQIKRKFAVGHIRAGEILEQLRIKGIIE